MINHHLKTLLIIFILSFLILYPLQIVRSASIAYILKEFGLDVAARIIARIFTSKLGNDITDFISKNGRDGGPNFIQHWRGFLSDSQYRGEDITRAVIGDAIDAGSGTICSYLRSPLASIFNAGKIPGFDASKYRVNSLQYYKLRNRCTLPAGFDVNLFRNDFSAGGGWAAWDQLIQPQNNIWGVVGDTQNELEQQRSFEQTTDSGEVQAGGGFTSKRSGDLGCELKGQNTSCLVLGQVLTPADIFKDTIGKINTAEFDWLTGSDELSEVVTFAASWVTGRLNNLVTAKSATSFTADNSAARDYCIKAGRLDCQEKAKKLNCSAEGGSGGSGGDGSTNSGTGSGGSGGDGGSVDCKDEIDQGIYDACMAEVTASCNTQSPDNNLIK